MRKMSKVGKIVSIVLVLSLISSLVVCFAGASDRYRVGVFTKDNVTYGKIQEDDAEVEHYKYSRLDDKAYYDVAEDGTYNRIDYHRIDLIYCWYKDDPYKVIIPEGKSIDVEAGVITRSATLQTGGFESIPEGATVTWKTNAPEYVLRLEPDPNDSTKCKITAMDSAMIDATEWEWLKGVIANIKDDPNNENVAKIRDALLTLNPEAIDVNGIITLLTVVGNVSVVDESYAAACLKIARDITSAKELKMVLDRCITLEYTYGGKTDTTTIMVDVQSAVIPKIQTNILNSQNGFDINTDVKAGDVVDLNAKVTPLRFNLGVAWSLKSNTCGATIDENGTVTFNNPGKVTVVASPDLGDTLAMAELLYDFVQQIAGKVGDSDTMLDIIITVLGLGDSQFKGLFKIVLKLYLKFIENEMLSDIVKTIGVTVGNFVLKLVASSQITFTVA